MPFQDATGLDIGRVAGHGVGYGRARAKLEEGRGAGWGIAVKRGAAWLNVAVGAVGACKVGLYTLTLLQLSPALACRATEPPCLTAALPCEPGAAPAASSG